jgi:hypothetical protein
MSVRTEENSSALKRARGMLVFTHIRVDIVGHRVASFGEGGGAERRIVVVDVWKPAGSIQLEPQLHRYRCQTNLQAGQLVFAVLLGCSRWELRNSIRLIAHQPISAAHYCSKQCAPTSTPTAELLRQTSASMGHLPLHLHICVQYWDGSVAACGPVASL